jgi:hypothetical protein
MRGSPSGALASAKNRHVVNFLIVSPRHNRRAGVQRKGWSTLRGLLWRTVRAVKPHPCATIGEDPGSMVPGVVPCPNRRAATHTRRLTFRTICRAAAVFLASPMPKDDRGRDGARFAATARRRYAGNVKAPARSMAGSTPRLGHSPRRGGSMTGPKRCANVGRGSLSGDRDGYRLVNRELD